MMNVVKYELIPEGELFRLIAVRDFGIVRAGDRGGLVSGPDNLFHEGLCWVFGEARVSGDARVFGSAVIAGAAQVYGSAVVRGEVVICGNARVYGDARAFDAAQISGNVQIYGETMVYGEARVYGEAEVYGGAQVYGEARVFGEAEVYGEARVFGDAWVYGEARVSYRVPVISGLPRHPITILRERINIGCESHSIAHWIENVHEIGARHGYRLHQIEIYRQIFETVSKMQEAIFYE